MAELVDLSRKIRMLIEQLDQVTTENKELIGELEMCRNENETLKRELEEMFENLKMMKIQSVYASATMSIAEPEPDYPKLGRILPCDEDNKISSDSNNKKGKKKTSF
jgi:regulator of replication initiation timing